MENDSEHINKVYKPYKELTLEILAALPDDELEHVIIDYIFGKFTNARNDEMRLEVVLNMSSGFQMIWFTWTLCVDVFHGGFNEFFYNGSDKRTNMTLRFLKMINAMEYYEILEKSKEAHREEMRNPIMQSLYSEQSLHGYSKSHRISSLKEYDLEFVNLDFSGLSALRIQFIRSNPELFIGS
jgi:hypothetical protein